MIARIRNARQSSWMAMLLLLCILSAAPGCVVGKRASKNKDGDAKKDKDGLPTCDGARKYYDKKQLYKVLGVKKKAKDKTIKKNYKKMAVKCHPDKNRDNENAQDNFIAVSGAYQTLSDEQERAAYDNENLIGKNGWNAHDSGANFEDLFKTSFGQGGGFHFGGGGGDSGDPFANLFGAFGQSGFGQGGGMHFGGGDTGRARGKMKCGFFRFCPLHTESQRTGLDAPIEKQPSTKKVLKTFYQYNAQRNDGKTKSKANIQALASKYAGREAKLYKKLQKKYGIDPLEFYMSQKQKKTSQRGQQSTSQRKGRTNSREEKGKKRYQKPTNENIKKSFQKSKHDNVRKKFQKSKRTRRR